MRLGFQQQLAIMRACWNIWKYVINTDPAVLHFMAKFFDSWQQVSFFEEIHLAI
jgi:DNA modification methylase